MRILIVKLGALGDAIMATAGLIPLRERYEGAHITWLAGRSVTPVLRLVPEIDELIEVDDAAILTGGTLARARALIQVLGSLAGRRFDLVLTAHPDRRYALLTKTVRAGERRRFSWDGSGVPFIHGRHHCDEYVKLFTGAEDDCAVPPVFPAVSCELSPRHAGIRDPLGAPVVLLAPGGARNLLRSDALRRWPVDHYAALATSLHEEGVRCVLIGDKHDAWTRPHFSSLDLIDLIGETTLEELLAICQASDALVTHDTGALHLGRLAGVPQVALFGPTNPSRVAPSERHHRAGEAMNPPAITLWGGAGLSCRPCYDGVDYADCVDNACLREVSPRRVKEAVMQLLISGRERVPQM